MQQLGDYMPITETERWRILSLTSRIRLGDLAAKPYIVSVKFLTEGIENLQSLLNRTSNDPTQQLQVLTSKSRMPKQNWKRCKARQAKAFSAAC